MHFARNDDGQGLETREADLGHRVLPAGADRPERTAAALHRGGDRAAGTEVGTFPAADVEVILFNEDFSRAAVPELKELADALHIKVRR